MDYSWMDNIDEVNKLWRKVMSQRQPDPRDAQSNGGNRLPVDAPTQDQQDVAVVSRPKSDNPFEFSDEDQALWGNDSMDTAICRAWARARARGIILGRPASGEYDVNNTTVGQDFTLVVARFDGNNDDNPNHLVDFSDARGVVITESGL